MVKYETLNFSHLNLGINQKQIQIIINKYVMQFTTAISIKKMNEKIYSHQRIKSELQ